MSRLFNVDNAFFTTINKIADLLFLSLVFDVCCIPALYFGLVAFQSMQTFDILVALIFILCTALVGPALTALYYAVAKAVRRQRGYAIPAFFHSYKSNFKQGALIGMIFGLAGTILYLDIYITNNTETVSQSEATGFIISAVFKAFILLLAMLFVYVFPVLSRFTMKLKTLLLSSFMMSIRHLPTTIMLLLIEGVAILGPIFLGYLVRPEGPDYANTIEYYFQFCFVFYLILPGVACFLVSYFLEKVFKIYMKPAETTEEESGEDRWYLE